MGLHWLIASLPLNSVPTRTLSTDFVAYVIVRTSNVAFAVTATKQVVLHQVECFVFALIASWRSYQRLALALSGDHVTSGQCTHCSRRVASAFLASVRVDLL